MLDHGGRFEAALRGSVEVGAELAAGPAIVFSGKKVTSSLARRFGIDRRDLGARIEAIKRAAGLRGSDNIRIDRAGNVYARGDDEILGNVLDELGGR